MAKKKRKCGTKCRAQRAKFGTAARGANKVCHRDTNSVPGYKKCMSTEMKARLGGGKKKKAGVKKCKGLYQSGANKGKIKPGYKRGPAGRCPVKKG
jgi:hypothetical protein